MASLDDALKLAQSYGFIGHGGAAPASAMAAEEDSVGLAILRLRLAQGGGAPVTGALNDALRRAQRDGHQAQQARLLLLRALHQHRAHDPAMALRTLDDALALAARCGLLRSLVDAEPQLLDLVEAIGARRPVAPPGVDDYLRRLLAAAGRTPVAAAAAAAEPARARSEAEELTEREIRILRLLKAGLGNRELAQSLFLSEATVKWHLHNIFAKLGVKNRIGALARAQEKSLL
jgi:LuxR family maltose regulon positive regulatory protein